MLCSLLNFSRIGKYKKKTNIFTTTFTFNVFCRRSFWQKWYVKEGYFYLHYTNKNIINNNNNNNNINSNSSSNNIKCNNLLAICVETGKCNVYLRFLSLISTNYNSHFFFPTNLLAIKKHKKVKKIMIKCGSRNIGKLEGIDFLSFNTSSVLPTHADFLWNI